MANINEKIAGLYVAFFNRAADKEGLDYWASQAGDMGVDTAVAQLAAGFASHVMFTRLYDQMSNRAYVEAIYTNCLGSPGDEQGIGYWSGILDAGGSRSDMVAAFVTATLDFDANAPQVSGLSQAEIHQALQRQAYLANKVEVALNFVETLSDLTNLDSGTDVWDPDSLDSDLAYRASVKMLSGVTHDTATAVTAMNSLALIQGRSDAIEILNSVSTVTEKDIAAQIHLLDGVDDLSHINESTGPLSTFDTYGVSALDSGVHWNEDTAVITYSFNSAIPSEYYTYAGRNLTQGWAPLNAAQKAAFRSIAEQVGKLLDITLQEVDSGGDIKLNTVDMVNAGFSFYPGSDVGYAGDIFLSSNFHTDLENFGLNPGESGWSCMAHELGHALGLKHPFEDGDTLPTDEDDIAHSVMSYTYQYQHKPVLVDDGYNEIRMTWATVNPDLYSLYDVAALQAIYGVNSSTRTGDDTYSFRYSDFPMQTIWDAGGTDHLDLSYTLGNTTLDMRGGTLNSVDQYSLEQIVAYFQAQEENDYFYDWIEDRLTDLYEKKELYTGLNNIGIAHGTIIENITTGAGDDKVTDNEVDNVIRTSAGDDAVYIGNGGYDTVDGGAGMDTLYLDVASAQQITVMSEDRVNYTIVADRFAVDVTGIETVHFNDNTTYAIDALV